MSNLEIGISMLWFNYVRLVRSGYYLLCFLCLVTGCSDKALPTVGASDDHSSKSPPVGATIVVAPHPDDEILGATSIIAKTIRENKNILIVIMTNGDAHQSVFEYLLHSRQLADLNKDGVIDYIDMGFLRRKESLNALNALGIKETDVIFLGYPDGGLKDLFNNIEKKGKYTKATKVPYPFCYHPDAPYTRQSVISALKEIFARFNPQVVYTPTPSDQHGDHNATYSFVDTVIKATGLPVKHLGYLIHWEQVEHGFPGDKGKDWHLPFQHTPPKYAISLADIGLSFKEKIRLIQFHTNQVNVNKNYLFGFAKQNEIFWEFK